MGGRSWDAVITTLDNESTVEVVLSDGPVGNWLGQLERKKWRLFSITSIEEGEKVC